MNHQKVDNTEECRVHSSIRMIIPLNKQSEALEILSTIKAQVQFEPHCISSQLYRSADEEKTIMIEELWKSHKDMLPHLQSDVYQRILFVIEMAEEPPDIRFETIAHLGGIEVIKSARKKLSKG